MLIENTLKIQTDDKLVVELASSPDAFWELVERHHRSVYRYFAVSVSPERALQMTACTFWTMLQHHRSFRQTEFAPWFFGITWDVINDNCGTPKRNYEAFSSTQPEAFFQKDTEHAFYILRNIPFYPREMLYLRFFASLNVKDIAAMMDQKEADVKSLIFEGVQYFEQQWNSAEPLPKHSKIRQMALAELYHDYISNVFAGITPYQSIPVEFIRATNRLNALREALSLRTEMQSVLMDNLKNMLIRASRSSGRL